MRQGAYWLVLLIAATAAGYAVYGRYEGTRPCARPVHFSIGQVDARFGTATSTVVREAQAAAAIWNAAASRQVLLYDASAALKVNLVYDSREAAAKLGEGLAREKAALDAAKGSIDAQKAEYDAREASYNEQVLALNAAGGATRAQAASLEAERSALRALADALESRVALYNTDVRAFNEEAGRYNATAGHTFEEGQYVEDASGARINIFSFVDATQLERVLAHELGHAIGLDHNDDPDSIMYAENESGNLKPTGADLSALKALCGT